MSILSRFQNFDLHMKTIADYYKGMLGIEIQHQHNVLTDGVHIYAKMKNSKGVTYTASVVISRVDIEDEYSDEIIRNMIQRLIQDVKDSEMAVNVSSMKNIVSDALSESLQNTHENAMADAFDGLVTKVSTGTVSVNVGSGGGGTWTTGTGGNGITIHNPTILPSYVQDRYDTLADIQKKGVSVEDLTKIAPLKNLAKSAIDSIFDSLPRTTFSYNRMRIEQSIVLAGGFFASNFHHEKPKDIDVFILNSPIIHKAFHDAIIEIHNQDDTRFTLSDGQYLNTINNKIKNVILDTKTSIQYIFTEYDSREELINHFDAEHACVSYYKDILYASPLAIDCIKKKILKSHRGNTIAQWRVDKFIKKGFTLASNRV